MTLFDSIVNLAAETGFAPDTILWIFGFGMAVYWIVSIAILGLSIVFFTRIFRFLYWEVVSLLNRKK